MRPAEDRIDAAYKSIRKGRLRQALDILNDAVLADPYDPETFAVRAEVFERLGLFPQAEADRQHALDLGWAPPPPLEPPIGKQKGRERLERQPQRALEPAPTPQPPAEPAAPPPQPEAPWEEQPAEATPAARLPVPVRRRPSVSLAGLLAYVPVGAVLKLLAGAAVVGAGVALFLIAPWEGDSGGGTAPDTPTTAGPTPTPAPPTDTPFVPTVAEGSPYSSADMTDAWEAAGLTVQASVLIFGLEGFTGAAVEATGSNASGQILAYLLVYPTSEAALAEWNLTPGQTLGPKGGRTLPPYVSIWWNQNIVVVVRSATGDTASAAFNALLNLTP